MARSRAALTASRVSSSTVAVMLALDLGQSCGAGRGQKGSGGGKVRGSDGGQRSQAGGQVGAPPVDHRKPRQRLACCAGTPNRELCCSSSSSSHPAELRSWSGRCTCMPLQALTALPCGSRRRH